MPALYAVLCLAAGLVTASFAPVSAPAAWTVAAVLLYAGTLIHCFPARSGQAGTLFAVLLLFASGMAAYRASVSSLPVNHYTAAPSSFAPDTDHIVQVTSIPEQRPRYAAMRARLLAVRDSSGAVTPMTGTVRLTITNADAARYAYGMRLHVRGTLSRPQGARNPGAFDYRSYLARQGIHGILNVKSGDAASVISTGHGNPLFTSVIAPLKQRITAVINASLPGRYAPLLAGMLLGDRGTIDREILGAFSDSGVIHILAVSGLHVGLVVAFFFALFKFVRLPFRSAVMATIGTVVLYMFITDLRPSVVRASIMAITMLTGVLLERDGKIYNTIASAALIILFIWPQALTDVGFQLSFAATISIIYLYPRIADALPEPIGKPKGRWGKWLMGGFMVSLSAQLGTAPITAYYFNKVSWIALAANLAVIPLVFCIVSSGFALVMAGLIIPPMANLIGWLITLQVKIMLYVVELFSKVPSGYFEPASPSLYQIIGFFILLALAAESLASHIARKILVFGVLGYVVVYLFMPSSDDTFRITFLDSAPVGAALIQTPDHKAFLINGGGKKGKLDNGERILLPCLKSMGIKKLDGIIITGMDDGRLGGVPSILRNRQVSWTADPGIPYKSWAYRHYQDRIKQDGIINKNPGHGTVYSLGNGASMVLLRPEQPGADLLIPVISCSGRQILYPGNLDAPGFRSWVRYGTFSPGNIVYGTLQEQSIPQLPEILDQLKPHALILRTEPPGLAVDVPDTSSVKVFRPDLDGAVEMEIRGNTVDLRFLYRYPRIKPKILYRP